MFLQEVAEPLQDLKEGMDQLEKNKTLRYILTTLLAIGNFLNSTDVSDCGPMNDPGPPQVSFTAFISSHAPSPAPLPTYLFGEDDSGLCVCTRMCSPDRLSGPSRYSESVLRGLCLVCLPRLGGGLIA